MVKYYTANTGESGWAVNSSYRDLMAGGDDVMMTGPSYTVTALGKTTQYAPFKRDDEFYYCHDSTGKDALYTDGITGCAAVVYFYRQGTTITLVAMGHINCGKFERANKGPYSLAKVRAFTAFDAVDVVVAHGSAGKYTACHEYVMGDGVKSANILDYFDPLIKDYAANKDGWIGRHMWGSPTVADTTAAQPEATTKCKCFLTTATCASLGLDEDCADLRDMRRFRDQVLARMPGGPAEIEAYYRIAPRLVAAIDASADPLRTYRALYAGWIAPAVAAIRAGANHQAYARYRRMIEMLMARYPDAAEGIVPFTHRSGGG